jgi:hypothetical protein
MLELRFVFSFDVRIIQNQIILLASLINLYNISSINGSRTYTTETAMTCYTYSSMFYIFLFLFSGKSY